MGMCFTNQNTQQKSKIEAVYNVGSNNLNSKQQFLLRLIYNDLKQRIPENAINLQNFLLFFHKNGFWGTRLFQQFAPASNLIMEDEFIDGMAKLTKTDEDKKIELLFKFFSSSSYSPCKTPGQLNDSFYGGNRTASSQRSVLSRDNGVKFDDFLVMLYNYPKEDLKQILNDRDFFEKEIKNSLVTIGQRHRLQSVYNLGLSLNRKDHVVFRVDDRLQKSESGTDDIETEFQPSMVGKDILRQMKRREIDQTTLKLKDGDKTLQIKTNNIHHLVKKFAKNMFRTLNLDIHKGQQLFDKRCRLNIRQFANWIKEHDTLYKNYYQGFHNDIWQYDPFTQKCKFLITPSEKQALSKYQIGQVTSKSYLMLKHSVIIVCQQQPNSDPIDIICLQGLQVSKIFQEHQGFGFLISHRDGFYPQKKIFMKNQTIRDDWNDSLKFFKGESIENNYAMGKKIGTGKFSVVYEAINKETKDQAAIKVIDFKELDLSARKLIAHESSIMQIFCHPLLVQFKSCHQTKTHMYIITELCPGKDLFEFVKEMKHLDEKESACIIQQVIVGVRYMHSLGIIHRDLKPQNVMVSYNHSEKKVQTVKIIDFGFANYMSTFSSMTPDQTLAGTPNYISPQLLRGQMISYKSDNFAIGSILYFMLSGSLPFNSETLTDIFSKTLEGNYSFKGKSWQKISRQAKNLIDGFLQSDPQNRLSLEDALKHPWFKEVKERNSTKVKLDKLSTSNQNLGLQSTREISY